MKKKYFFRENYDNDLITLLNDNKIKYAEKKNDFIGMHLVVFSVDDSQLANKIMAFAKNEPIIEVKYSPKELESSQLIRIHAKRQEIDIINELEAFDFDCKLVDKNGIGRAHHKKQIKSVKIDKLPKEKKGSVLYSTTLGFGELFADARFFSICEKNNITGIQFLPVYDKKGTKLNSLWQLTTNNVIFESNIALGYGELITSCPVCNKKKIISPYAYELHLDLNRESINQDFYVTERLFGEGISEPYFLISQRLYRLLLEEGLLNDLEITPVSFC